MPVIFARVDDRLIHGQVVQGWLPGMKIDEVAVVREAHDKLAADLMRLALPPEYDFRVLSAEDASDYLQKTQKRVFVIFEDLKLLGRALKKGLKLTSVNIGGLHYQEGRDKILKDVYLTPEEKIFVKDLIARGVSVDGRSVAAEPHVSPEGVL